MLIRSQVAAVIAATLVCKLAFFGALPRDNRANA
jgi:hypothetical protein